MTKPRRSRIAAFYTPCTFAVEHPFDDAQPREALLNSLDAADGDAEEAAFLRCLNRWEDRRFRLHSWEK